MIQFVYLKNHLVTIIFFYLSRRFIEKLLQPTENSSSLKTSDKNGLTVRLLVNLYTNARILCILILIIPLRVGLANTQRVCFSPVIGQQNRIADKGIRDKQRLDLFES